MATHFFQRQNFHVLVRYTLPAATRAFLIALLVLTLGACGEPVTPPSPSSKAGDPAKSETPSNPEGQRDAAAPDQDAAGQATETEQPSEDSQADERVDADRPFDPDGSRRRRCVERLDLPGTESLKPDQRSQVCDVMVTLTRGIEISFEQECLNSKLGSAELQCKQLFDIELLQVKLRGVGQSFAVAKSLHPIPIDVAFEFVLTVEGHADSTPWRNKKAPLRLYQDYEILRKKHPVLPQVSRRNPDLVVSCARAAHALDEIVPVVNEFVEDLEALPHFSVTFRTEVNCITNSEHRGARARLVFTTEVPDTIHRLFLDETLTIPIAP